MPPTKKQNLFKAFPLRTAEDKVNQMSEQGFDLLQFQCDNGMFYGLFSGHPKKKEEPEEPVE